MKKRFFSRVELREIIISFIVLGIIFSYPEFIYNPAIIPAYMIVIAVAFIGHELSHKFIAIRLGVWSEYRIWKEGLLMAFGLAIATGGMFIFAAPGAVYFAQASIFRRLSVRNIGLIGLAGPLFNAAAFIVSAFLFSLTGSPVLYMLMAANVFIGLFNMIPAGPLDGLKIIRWKKSVWACLFLVLAAGSAFMLLQGA